MQFQADVMGVAVRRPKVLETTALGAAYLAGLATGFWESKQADREELAGGSLLRAARSPTERREELYAGWLRAVERALGAVRSAEIR